mmetsp:Transcript_11646/g.30332  ORF Transcript_11646/g.30332 Transcript_11646/m.30332 type:complete len:472 (-) Transcript_11646:84-1499(-)
MRAWCGHEWGPSSTDGSRRAADPAPAADARATAMCRRARIGRAQLHVSGRTAGRAGTSSAQPGGELCGRRRERRRARPRQCGCWSLRASHALARTLQRSPAPLPVGQRMRSRLPTGLSRQLEGGGALSARCARAAWREERDIERLEEQRRAGDLTPGHHRRLARATRRQRRRCRHQLKVAGLHKECAALSGASSGAGHARGGPACSSGERRGATRWSQCVRAATRRRRTAAEAGTPVCDRRRRPHRRLWPCSRLLHAFGRPEERVGRRGGLAVAQVDRSRVTYHRERTLAPGQLGCTRALVEHLLRLRVQLKHVRVVPGAVHPPELLTACGAHAAVDLGERSIILTRVSCKEAVQPMRRRATVWRGQVATASWSTTTGWCGSTWLSDRGARRGAGSGGRWRSDSREPGTHRRDPPLVLRLKRLHVLQLRAQLWEVREEITRDDRLGCVHVVLFAEDGLLLHRDTEGLRVLL